MFQSTWTVSLEDSEESKFIGGFFSLFFRAFLSRGFALVLSRAGALPLCSQERGLCLIFQTYRPSALKLTTGSVVSDFRANSRNPHFNLFRTSPWLACYIVEKLLLKPFLRSVRVNRISLSRRF
uniref:Uncharacterized protein n=1 Tax=Heterorhabditis bacteriophora TaxID=37862 RepID=A0A1I7WVZ3_HETBA